MLPLVGLAAIGLLFVAGKFFFFSDFQADRQPIHVSIGPPDSSRANAEGSGTSVVAQNPNNSRAPVRANTGAALASNPGNIDIENRAQNSAGVVADDQSRDDVAYQHTANVIEETTREIIVVSSPESQPNPNPVSAASEPAQPANVQPDRPYWMVQVGALSTNAAAQTLLNRVTQEGHRATIVSGGRWHRVLVYAGPTNQDASELATRLGRSGYQGAFTVPPR